MATRRELEAGRAALRMRLDDAAINRGLKAMEKRLRMVGDRLNRMGRSFLKVGGLISGAFAGAAVTFAKTGDNLDKMSNRTRISVETLSLLDFAASQAGTSLDSVAQAIFRANRRIGNAATNTGPAVRALRELKIEAAEFAKLSPEDQFFQLADALNDQANASRAAQLGFEIFGDNFRQIVPLLRLGSDGMRSLMKEGEALGLGLDRDATASAVMLTDTLDKLRRQLAALVVRIGEAVAGPITTWTTKTQTIIASTISWVRANQALIRTVAALGVLLSAAGAALLIMGTASLVVAGSLKLISGFIGLLFSKWALLVGAILASTGAFFKFSEVGKGLGKTLMDTFNAVVNLLTTGNLEKAGEVAMAGLAVAWERGKNTVLDTWDEFAEVMLQVWNDVQKKIARAYVKTMMFVKKNTREVSDFFKDAFDFISTAQLKATPTAGISGTAALNKRIDEERDKRVMDREKSRKDFNKELRKQEKDILADLDDILGGGPEDRNERRRKRFDRERLRHAALESKKAEFEALRKASQEAAENAAAGAGAAMPDLDLDLGAVGALAGSVSSPKSLFNPQFASRVFGRSSNKQIDLLSEIAKSNDEIVAAVHAITGGIPVR